MTVREMTLRMGGPELDRWKQFYLDEARRMRSNAPSPREAQAPPVAIRSANEEPDDDDSRVWETLRRERMG
jgi:hypothetical protein